MAMAGQLSDTWPFRSLNRSSPRPGNAIAVLTAFQLPGGRDQRLVEAHVVASHQACLEAAFAAEHLAHTNREARASQR